MVFHSKDRLNSTGLIFEKEKALGFWECSCEWHIGFLKVAGAERVRGIEAAWSEVHGSRRLRLLLWVCANVHCHRDVSCRLLQCHSILTPQRRLKTLSTENLAFPQTSTIQEQRKTSFSNHLQTCQIYTTYHGRI